MLGSLAVRYARALVELGEEAQSLEKIAEELKQAAELFGSPELSQVFSNKLLQKNERRAALEQIILKVSFSDTIKNFLSLLFKRDRLFLLTRIERAYEKLCDERRGILRADIKTAEALPETTAGELVAVLEQKTQKTVKAKFSKDQELLGGMTLRLGSLFFDGSLQGDLRRLKQNLNA